MVLRLEADHYWIDHKEYGDMFMYNDDPDVFLRLETLDDLKKVLELIAKHGCYVTTFAYLKNDGQFHIEIEKEEMTNDEI